MTWRTRSARLDMRRPPWRCAVVLLVVSLVLAGVAAAATPRRDRTVSGDVIKAVRLLQTARIDQARLLLEDLHKRAPDAVEVKWLAAELAFQLGDLESAIQLLEGLPEGAVDGMVGQTRRLVKSTLSVTESFVATSSPKGRFVIRYAPGPDAVIAALAGEVLDAAWEAIGDDLGIRPSDPIRVEILGAPTDLAKLSTLSEADIERTGTIALAKYNKLMVVSPRATMFGYPWMDTLAHEYTHLAVSRLAHEAVPVWLQEGLARFEQTRWRRAPGVQLSATEQAVLAGALKRGRLISFDQMHPSMAKLPSQEAAALAYAEVYTFVGWVHGKVGYKGIREALHAQRDGKSARRAMAEVLDSSWGKVERAWQKSLRMDRPAIDRAGTGRRSAPIKFSKGGVHSENVGLEQVSAKTRKYARLGGMLRARGELEASVVEYEKALASGYEPMVAGKLARTLVDLGRFDRAIELATPLVAADEHDAVAAVTLGVARAARAEWVEAIPAFEQALRVSPFDPITRCGLAEAYGKTSNPRAAREQAACKQLKDQP